MGDFLNGFIGFSLLATFGAIYAVLMFVSDYEPNKCEMTYMFEYPQFVRISNVADKQYKKYGLYAYSEGHLTQKARNMYFDGIPVLFIPGNAGSYKQVRSLASVALRKSINSRTEYHFDYFTIDTNEELSGFNGVLLNDQLAYANYSIHRILELYKNSQGVKPKSVIVIGHSMGGIIAKGLLASLPMESDLIPLVITLASPHQRLPVFFDIYSYNFYKNIDRYQADKWTNIVNVFGGYRDFMVTPNLVQGRGVNAVTTNVPKTWLPTDHLCILWCKQLVLVLNRALFESVDRNTKQLSTDFEYVETVFSNHLIKNSGTRGELDLRYNSSTTIDDTGEWIEYLQRQYTANLYDGTKQIKWYMIRLVKHALHEKLTVLAINLEVTDWVFVCSAIYIKGQGRTCQEGMHLSHLSEIAPSVRHKRRLININLHELQYKYPTFTHVVIRTLPTSEPVTLHVDVHETNQRTVQGKLPNLWLFGSEVVVKETIEKAVHYEIHFPKLAHVNQAFLLHIKPIKCNADSYHVTASLIAPWSSDQYHHHFTEVDNKPMPLRLFTSKPMNANENMTAYVRLTLDPVCQYTVSVATNIPMALAQFARFYSPYLFTYVATVVLLSFVYQLKFLHDKHRCPLLLSCLRYGTRPYYFLPAVKILTQILSVPALQKFIPLPDWFFIQEEGLDFFFLPIILYFVAVGVVWMLSVLLMIWIFLFESTIHKLALKVISKMIRSPVNWSDWLLSGFQKFPVVVAGALIVMSTTTCGGLALCLGCIFYFLKLTQMSQDVIEDIVKKLVKLFGVYAKTLFSKKHTTAAQKSTNQGELEGTKCINSNKKVSVVKDDNKTKDDADTKKITDKIELGNIRIQNEDEIDLENEENDEPKEELGKIDDEDQTTTQLVEELIETKESTSDTPKVPDNQDLSDDKTLLSILVGNLLQNNELFFHFTMFCIWFLITCLNVPTVLTWAHNFKYSPKLIVDPSFIPGVTMCICAVPLWQFDYPKIKRNGYGFLSYLVHVLAVFGLTYGTFSLFVLNYVLCAVVVIVVAHQMFAPNRTIQVISDNTDNADDGFKKLKSKME